MLSIIGFLLLANIIAGISGLSFDTSQCEELLEMTGVALFIYTLLLHMSDELNNLTVSIKNSK